MLSADLSIYDIFNDVVTIGEFIRCIYNMKTLAFTFLTGLAIVSGCTQPNNSDGVDTLQPQAQVQQRITLTGLSTSLAPSAVFSEFGSMKGDRSFHADIAFYEVVLSYGTVTDPRPVFLLANAYIVSNQQKYGISYFERLLKRYQNQMSPDIKATYLSAYALLRATYAEQVSIPRRLFWVWDTFDILEESLRLSKNNPLVRWSAGIIYAQVPGFFGKREQALNELLWLAERPELEPNPGFYREVYHFLARLYANKGSSDLSSKYLRMSGYEDYEPSALFMGWFVTTKEKGLLFAPTPWIEEIVPGRVFAVRGFGFSDLHFVVTDNGEELISIDAGTQPYSMEKGYKFLKEHHPDLPKLTTVFITHAHWDHIGGYTYLKSLNPNITFYGRDNYANTVKRVLRNHVYHQFRGQNFKQEWVSQYQPDSTIKEHTELSIGATVVELIPVTGGETEDAMLINLPDLQVLFMGDALMPFYGEPWVEEGFIPETLEVMDEALRRKPKHILHGHVGITVLYGLSSQLKVYRDAYEWLINATRKHLSNSYSAKNIIRLNLIPPGLQEHPGVFFGYLSSRDHIISRFSDHLTGMWREEVTGQAPEGLDVITSVEYGRLLDLYLDLSVKEVENGIQKMLNNGDNELALQMAVAAEARYQNNEGITALKLKAADRLRSAVQYFDPFKFVTYTELIGKEHLPINLESK